MATGFFIGALRAKLLPLKISLESMVRHERFACRSRLRGVFGTRLTFLELAPSRMTSRFTDDVSVTRQLWGAQAFSLLVAAFCGDELSKPFAVPGAVCQASAPQR
jgi:hypothetical protein